MACLGKSGVDKRQKNIAYIDTSKLFLCKNGNKFIFVTFTDFLAINVLYVMYWHHVNLSLSLSLSMGSSGVQIICVALCILGLIGGIVTCIVPRWKVSAFVGNNIVTAQVKCLRYYALSFINLLLLVIAVCVMWSYNIQFLCKQLFLSNCTTEKCTLL